MLAKFRSLLTKLIGRRDRVNRPTTVATTSTHRASGAGAVEIPPAPNVGDKVYVPGFLHITHGVDDFEGGLVTVGEVRVDRIKGQKVAFVYIKEDESWVNWDTFLAPMQADLRKHFGSKAGKPRPDRRPEFNE